MTLKIPLEKNPYFKYLKNRCERYNKSNIIVITGDLGEGKTYTALKIGEILDPRFSISKVAFTPLRFLEILDTVKFIGEVIVFDEVGIALSAKKFWSQMNILTNEVLQTLRYKRITVIMVLPDFSFLDSQARKVVQFFCSVNRVMDKPPKLWVYWVKIDRKTGNIYHKHPSFDYEGRRFKLRSIIINEKPSKRLVEDYERYHKEYKEALRKKNISKLRKLEAVTSLSLDGIKDQIKEDTTLFINPKTNKLDVYLIKHHFKISYNHAYEVKRVLDLELGGIKGDV